MVHLSLSPLPSRLAVQSTTPGSAGILYLFIFHFMSCHIKFNMYKEKSTVISLKLFHSACVKGKGCIVRATSLTWLKGVQYERLRPNRVYLRVDISVYWFV